MRHDASQPVLVGDLPSKPVAVVFDAPSQRSDGGLPLSAASDRKLGLTERRARVLVDLRRSKRSEHDLTGVVRQRVYGITHGYADCPDASRIGDDPIPELTCGRSPSAETGLAPQPTLSRFRRGQGGGTPRCASRMGWARREAES